jgi:hypothetical protein
MNLNKAREYFSAYQEGTLDKGLSQTFERALREDAQLQAEYRAFEKTMAELSQLGQKEIEPPADLHEIISARLDRQIWENKQTHRGGMRQWLKLTLAGGLATAVLAVALILPGRSAGSDKNVTEAGISNPISSKKAELFKPIENGVAMSYLPTTTQTVVITDAAGVELDQPITLTPDNQLKDKPLQNKGEGATLICVKIGSEDAIWVALPGSKRNEMTDGTGSVKQFVQALADAYGTAVVLKSKQPDREISWKSGTDLMSTANSLTESKLKPELRQSNGSADSLLWIQEH